MLEVNGITVSYQKSGENPVIRDMSWQQQTGTVLAVAGPSGCGKSTLLHTLAGILPFDGIILLDEKPLAPKTCSIGLIPQNYGLLPWKTVRENCLFTARIRNNEPDSMRRLSILCEALGIGTLLERYPGTLSGGQAQRAALARAFLMDPELLLMDEPFAALDVAAARTARDVFFRLWNERKPTTVIVTHRVEDALYLAHDIAVMGRDGSFVCRRENPWRGEKRTDHETCAKWKREITDVLIQADRGVRL